MKLFISHKQINTFINEKIVNGVETDFPSMRMHYKKPK